MILIVIFLSIFAFFKTIGYAIYEFNDNSNKVAGIIIRHIILGCFNWSCDSNYN